MYLTLNATYSSVEVALCNAGSIIDARSIDKYEASGQLIVALDQLCKSNTLTLTAMACIVTQAGPGPFSTLRAMIATANGLAAATGIKLVSVDGLRTFISQHHHSDYPVTVALMNAYSNDLYYAIEQHGQITTGIAYGTPDLEKIGNELPTTMIRFIGNGVRLHEKTIKDLWATHAYLPEPMPETCSLSAVARVGWQQWLEQKDVMNQLVPLYLKTYSSR